MYALKDDHALQDDALEDDTMDDYHEDINGDNDALDYNVICSGLQQDPEGEVPLGHRHDPEQRRRAFPLLRRFSSVLPDITT
jgi:hypothetical protein